MPVCRQCGERIKVVVEDSPPVGLPRSAREAHEMLTGLYVVQDAHGAPHEHSSLDYTQAELSGIYWQEFDGAADEAADRAFHQRQEGDG